MPKKEKKRDKKLFNDELCHVCKTRPAKGFKVQVIFEEKVINLVKTTKTIINLFWENDPHKV